MPTPDSPTGDVKDVTSGSSPTPEAPASSAQATAAAPAAPADSAAAAAPAGGPQDQQPKTVLEAVLQGLDKDKNKAPSAPAAGDPSAQPGGDKSAATDAGGEQPGQPPKDANTRIRQLVAENKQLASKATYFDQMQTWTVENGLDQKDIEYALNLIRLVKNDPTKAQAMLAPLVNRVQTAMGERLPADLQEQLDKGLISEENARELAQRRANEAFHGERGRREAARRQHDEHVRQVEQVAGSIGTAVSGWEREWEKRDPDYAKKQKFVSSEIARLMQENGVPGTPEEAVKVAKQALENVEKEMAGLLPPRTSIRPPMGGSAPRSAPQAKSSFEAAKAGLEKARAGQPA